MHGLVGSVAEGATCITPAFRHACNVEQECEQASTIVLARLRRIVAGGNFNPTVVAATRCIASAGRPRMRLG